MKTDIEIARETKLNKIEDVAEKLGVPRDEVQNYGRYIAKVPIHLIDKKEMEKHNLIRFRPSPRIRRASARLRYRSACRSA